MHRPGFTKSVNPLHRTAAYPTVPHDLTQNDEADRVLLRTGHHGQKSERICSTADFSPTKHTKITDTKNRYTKIMEVKIDEIQSEK